MSKSTPTRPFFGLPGAFKFRHQAYAVQTFDDPKKIPQDGFICAVRGPGFNLHPQKAINVRAGEKIECFVTNNDVTVRVSRKIKDKRKRRAKYTRDFIFMGARK